MEDGSRRRFLGSVVALSAAAALPAAAALESPGAADWPTDAVGLNAMIAKFFDVAPEIGTGAVSPVGLPYSTQAWGNGTEALCVAHAWRAMYTIWHRSGEMRPRLYWRKPFAYSDGRKNETMPLLRGRFVVPAVHGREAEIVDAEWQRPVFGAEVREADEPVEMVVRIPSSREGRGPVMLDDPHQTEALPAHGFMEYKGYASQWRRIFKEKTA